MHSGDSDLVDHRRKVEFSDLHNCLDVLVRSDETANNAAPVGQAPRLDWHPETVAAKLLLIREHLLAP